jgi:hypothetical protein
MRLMLISMQARRVSRLRLSLEPAWWQPAMLPAI